MILINTNKIFGNAIKSKNADTTEKLLLCSDNIQDLIRTYSHNEDIDDLLTLIPNFKSKGLIQNLENLIENNVHKTSKIQAKISRKIVLTHYDNKKNNERTHLSSTRFPGTKS